MEERKYLCPRCRTDLTDEIKGVFYGAIEVPSGVDGIPCKCGARINARFDSEIVLTNASLEIAQESGRYLPKRKAERR